MEHAASDGSAGALADVVVQVRALAEAEPGTRFHGARICAEHGTVLVHVDCDDEASFEGLVRERFGFVVDLYFDQWGRENTRFEDWSVDASGTVVTVTWTGGGFERDHGLDADERDDEVHLTAWSIAEIGMRRAAGGKGPGEGRAGQVAQGYPATASTTLSRPLGDRRVLDDQRDRIKDRPPVERDGTWIGGQAWDYVDTLDWADVRGYDGPGENGWVRIYATVDDTKRLEDVLNERFGGGIEVVYKEPYPPVNHD